MVAAHHCRKVDTRRASSSAAVGRWSRWCLLKTLRSAFNFLSSGSAVGCSQIKCHWTAKTPDVDVSTSKRAGAWPFASGNTPQSKAHCTPAPTSSVVSAEQDVILPQGLRRKPCEHKKAESKNPTTAVPPLEHQSHHRNALRSKSKTCKLSKPRCMNKMASNFLIPNRKSDTT